MNIVKWRCDGAENRKKCKVVNKCIEDLQNNYWDSSWECFMEKVWKWKTQSSLNKLWTLSVLPESFSFFLSHEDLSFMDHQENKLNERYATANLSHLWKATNCRFQSPEKPNLSPKEKKKAEEKQKLPNKKSQTDLWGALKSLRVRWPQNEGINKSGKREAKKTILKIKNWKFKYFRKWNSFWNKYIYRSAFSLSLLRSLKMFVVKRSAR